MIPQEKAKELVNKYLQVYDGRLPISKQCALIAVDEILDLTKKNKYNWQDWNEIVGVHYDTYWQEVKEKIENI